MTTVVALICTEGGCTLHECPCDHSYRDNIIAKLGHDYVIVRQDSQYRYYKCTRCGRQRKEEAIPAPVDPPPYEYEIMGLEDEVSPASTSSATCRVLKSTVTEAHSYI